MFILGLFTGVTLFSSVYSLFKFGDVRINRCFTSSRAEEVLRKHSGQQFESVAPPLKYSSFPTKEI